MNLVPTHPLNKHNIPVTNIAMLQKSRIFQKMFHLNSLWRTAMEEFYALANVSS